MRQADFTLAQFIDQMTQVRKTGPLTKLIGVMPGMAKLAQPIGDVDIDRRITRMLGIYHSMTVNERQQPDLLNAARGRRIAAGAGVPVEEVIQFFRQFETSRCMAQQIGSIGLVPPLTRVLGLATNDPLRRDPSWTEREPRRERWRRLPGWIWLAVACAVAFAAWQCFLS